jgi:small subunit ribosomal protein S16
MVVIRLARRGVKKHPIYHLVAADKCCKRDGRFIEKLGHYNPITSTVSSLKQDRLDYWVKTGAQLSPRVTSILKKNKKAATATAQAE